MFLETLFDLGFGPLGFIVTAVAVLLTLLHRSRPPNTPPGPIGIPVLGFLPFFKKDRPKHLRELSKKYGPIISYYMGSHFCVALNDYETIRKALVDQADTFSGRPQNFMTNIDPINHKHITFSDGILWKEHRRFALSKFREYGIGKSSIEPAVLNEISYFLNELEKKKNQYFDLADLLGMSICNNVLIMGFGRRLEYDDPQFQKLKRMVDEMVPSLLGLPHLFLPWLKHVPGNTWLFNIEQVQATQVALNNYMRKEIRNHEKEYNDGAGDDYINAYITEKNKRIQNNNYQDLFDEDALTAILKGLFIAGMETTTTTLRWAILYLMMHPDVQMKVQKEIDDVIGANRMPSFEDRPQMPYTEAVLLEVHRMGSVSPVAFLHRVTNETKVNGFTFPKDTLVTPNIWAINYDEKLFPDPNTFRPERFLNEEGRAVKPDHLIPFGIGKRFCLGEPLARIELFLYFTSMFQRFTFKAPEGIPLTTEASISVTRAPKYPFKSHILLRSEFST